MSDRGETPGTLLAVHSLPNWLSMFVPEEAELAHFVSVLVRDESSRLEATFASAGPNEKWGRVQDCTVQHNQITDEALHCIITILEGTWLGWRSFKHPEQRIETTTQDITTARPANALQ